MSFKNHSEMVMDQLSGSHSDEESSSSLGYNTQELISVANSHPFRPLTNIIGLKRKIGTTLRYAVIIFPTGTHMSCRGPN